MKNNCSIINSNTISDDYDRRIFGKNIAVLRSHMGITQKEAAEKLKINISTYSKYEQGKTTPNIDNLCKIVQLYNISSDLLIFAKRNDLILYIDKNTKNEIFFETLIAKCRLMSDEDKARMAFLADKINAEKNLITSI